VRIDGSLPALPDPSLTCIYRVVQEALTNAARHSEAQNVEILVATRDHELELVVTDDGIGLAAGWDRGRGMGLVGMEERVREVGGTFEIGNQSGAGVRIRVRLPVPQVETHEQNASVGG
jgi:signal transduction histidine kinase